MKSRMTDSSQKLIVVVNKTDLIEPGQFERFSKASFHELAQSDVVVPISAREGINMDKLINELITTVNMEAVESDEVIVTNIRHYESLKKSEEAIIRVLGGLKSGVSGDFVSQDIREALYYLGEITGQISSDEVLGNIFKNFCIGK